MGILEPEGRVNASSSSLSSVRELLFVIYLTLSLGIILGIDKVSKLVSHWLSIILWFTFFIINFRDSGYWYGKKDWLIFNLL